MKNFRKVLALVLVVATLFSFVAMASAKELKDYTDAKDVSYDVAVEVLSALGILDGYEDNSFKPTNTIYRAEMAKMIAVLANAGEDDVDKIYASACDFADAKDHWAASYIAYCAQTGVVAGRSATTFDPYGKVTGLETAKMLLVTMGFDAKQQGYVGANWKINVLRDAKNFGLLDGFKAGYKVEDPITREQAANMMLNALMAPTVVGYLNENAGVTVTNALYNWFKGTTLPDAEKYGLVLMYKNVIVDSRTTLAEALYNGRLVLEDDIYDCQGRPGSKWTLTNKGGKKILDGKFFADPMYASYTKEVDIEDVIDAVAPDYDVIAFEDGYNVKTLPETGKGVLTEIYINDAEKEVTVVVINTYIGEVIAAPKASNTFSIDYVNVWGEGRYCFSNKGYNFEKGDIILYWLCDEDINESDAGVDHELHAAEIAEPTVGAVTRAVYNTDLDKCNATVAGKNMEYAYNFGVYIAEFYERLTGNKMPLMTAEEVAQSKNNGVEYAVYTDKYGYIMFWEENVKETEEKVAYVVEGSGEYGELGMDGEGNLKYNATKDFVDFDAKMTEGVKVDRDLFMDTRATKDAQGDLIKYTVDDDGRATVEEFATLLPVDAVLLENGDLGYTTDRGEYTTIAYGNSDSKYLVRTWDYAKEEYVYTAYTEDTLPSGFAGYVLRDDVDPDIVVGDRLMPTIQYFASLAGETKHAFVVDYVFVDAIYSLTAKRAFIVDYNKTVSDTAFVNQLGKYQAYDAYVNGKEGVLLVNLYDFDIISLEALRANRLVEATLECIGITDEGLPIYAAIRNYPVDPQYYDFEFVGNEITFQGGQFTDTILETMIGHSYDVADDFFAVLIDAEGDYQSFDDPAKLNDFVDSYYDRWHGFVCDNDHSDLDVDCNAYLGGIGWIVLNDDGEVAEMYLELITTDDVRGEIGEIIATGK